jgi:hypothetical protein
MSCKVIKAMLTNIPQQKELNLPLSTTWVKDYLHYSNILTVQFEVNDFAVFPTVFILNCRLTGMQIYWTGQGYLKLHVTEAPSDNIIHTVTWSTITAISKKYSSAHCSVSTILYCDRSNLNTFLTLTVGYKMFLCSHEKRNAIGIHHLLHTSDEHYRITASPLKVVVHPSSKACITHIRQNSQHWKRI